MKVYPSINVLVSAVKQSIVKQDAFSAIGLPPKPIITRWSSWLKAVVWYHENFDSVRDIVLNYQDDKEIVKAAKDAVNQNNIGQLVGDICRQYA
jgi:hypothetical protein